jgi:hypothetical protein
MGRRMTMGMARAWARVGVCVLHPDNETVRTCALRFSSCGVVLESATSGTPTALLRVPWWDVERFSVGDHVRGPDDTDLRALDLVTEQGVLRLAMPASQVVVALCMLSAHARRWRRWRHPASRWGVHLAIRASRAWQTALACAREAVHRSRRRPAVALAAMAVVLSLVVSAAGALTAGLHSAVHATNASAAAGRSMRFAPGIAGLVARAHSPAGSAALLPRASAPPSPAPASLGDSPALATHEVFGFVPYWSIGDEASFDVTGFTTLAYFALSVNADGTLQESGTGWDGYQSQAFADLVSRAHASGVRVVLSVNCFSLPTLEVLTSSRASQAALGAAVVAAIAAKHLDGVNIDFEGGGFAQRAGLTTLVATVASAVHAANPHDQVTVDTYASAATDPQSFYDVRALASVSDALFVMGYGLNYGAQPTAASPITSNEMSDVAEAAAYASAVPVSKVIFGTSYYGYSWATTTGTMAARATATRAPVTYAQLVASGEPIYWDPVTETAWTSYESSGQWYEDYVSSPTSVYLVAQLVEKEGFRGVGAWALGMDGNDPQMTAALDGGPPAQLAGPSGPVWTTPSRPTAKAATGRPAGGPTEVTRSRAPVTTTTTGVAVAGSADPGTRSGTPPAGSTNAGTGSTNAGTGSTNAGTGSTNAGTGSTNAGTGGTLQAPTTTLPTTAMAEPPSATSSSSPTSSSAPPSSSSPTSSSSSPTLSSP